ncbi:proteic killer suppression protein [Vibrio cholerae]|nr:proteic killer suppression protein [Vibrio cholerae]
MHNETVQVAMALEFKDKWLEQWCCTKYLLRPT